MSPEFHPYHEWLDIDRTNSAPHHYELLGLDCFVEGHERICAAADRALSIVRGHRPGPHTARWAALLDKLEQAKQTLLDADRKRAYDNQLRERLTQAIARENVDSTREDPAAVHRAPFNPDLYPPGFLPHGLSADPMAPVTNAHAIDRAAAPASAATAPAAAPVARLVEAANFPMQSVDPMAPIPLAQLVTPAPAAAAIPKGIPVAASVSADPGVGSSAKSAALHRSPASTALPITPHALHRPSNTVSTHRTAAPRESGAGPMITTIAAIVMLITCLGAVYLAVRAGRHRDGADDVAGDTARKLASGFANNDPKSAAGGKSLPAADATPGNDRKPSMAAPGDDRSAGVPRKVNTRKKRAVTDADDIQGSATPHPETTPPQPPVPDPDTSVPGSNPLPQPENAGPMPPRPAQQPGEPLPAPSEKDLIHLATTMRKARGLLGDGFAKRAKALLDGVAQVPKYPAHAQKYDRLALLAEHCANFETLLDKALTAFRGGSELKIGNSFVGVVEITAETVIIRAAGMNRRYSRQELPLKLSIVFIETGLIEDDLVLLAKGARVLSLAGAPDNLRSEARQWLERVSPARADEVKELETALYEDYDANLEAPPPQPASS